MVPKGPNSKPTIFLADYNGQLRSFVSTLIVQCGYNLIATNDGAKVIQDVREVDETIDLLLSPVEMTGVPSLNGAELAHRLSQERPQTKMFLLAGNDSGTLVLNHGWQFFLTPHKSDALLGRVRDVLPKLPTKRQSASPEDGLRGQATLTKREAQTLQLIAGGNSTKQIAVILGIAFKTAVGHRTRLMTKLDIHDSVTLVRYAIRAGIVDA